MTYDEIKRELGAAARLVDAGDVAGAYGKINAMIGKGVSHGDVAAILLPEQIRALREHARGLMVNAAKELHTQLSADAYKIAATAGAALQRVAAVQTLDTISGHEMDAWDEAKTVLSNQNEHRGSQRLAAALLLTVSKVVRGVIDAAASKVDGHVTQQEKAGCVVRGLVKFAEGCERNELAEREFVADMFVAACDDLARKAGDR
jgi:hypothetical protein